MRLAGITAGILLAALFSAPVLAESFVHPPSSSGPKTYGHAPPRPGEEQSRLCRTLTDHYAALGPTTSEMCTIALPRGRDFRRPSWRRIDPAENIDAIKEAFFWQFVDSQVNNSHYYNAEHRAFIDRLKQAWSVKRGYSLQYAAPKDIDPDLIDQAWDLFGAPVRKMIDAGALRLETARFDLNFDAIPDTVYRMTDLVFLVPRRPSDPVEIDAEIWHCQNVAGRDEDHPYVIFVRSQDAAGIANGGPNAYAVGARGLIDRLNDVFWYRGRPYLVWIERGSPSFVVSEPSAGFQSPEGPPSGGFFSRDICQMNGFR